MDVLTQLDSDRAATLTVEALLGDLSALLRLADLLGDHHGWSAYERDVYVGQFLRANLS
jgi:hypothetical protein